MNPGCEHLLFCCLCFVQSLSGSCNGFIGPDLLQVLWGAEVTILQLLLVTGPSRRTDYQLINCGIGHF